MAVLVSYNEGNQERGTMSTLEKLRELASKSRPSKPHKWLIEPELVDDAIHRLESGREVFDAALDMQKKLAQLRELCRVTRSEVARLAPDRKPHVDVELIESILRGEQ